LDAKAAEAELLAFALTLPAAELANPWGHSVAKVKGKVFVFFGGDAGEPQTLSLTVKLPVSAGMALTLPGVERAGYGLGKTGWIQLRRRNGDALDLELYRGWILQSYRAIAPGKLSAQLPQ
jgi:predicted DNA-binding protein (MmcQ/YjbR family)